MPAKERVGVVVSTKMQKTVVVAVENRSPSPKYRKTVVQTKRYKVHDEENRCNEGDRVRIQETRPLSRTKRWKVLEILEGTSLQALPSPAADAVEPEVAAEVAPAIDEPAALAEAPDASAAASADENPDESAGVIADDANADTANADATSAEENADDTPSA